MPGLVNVAALERGRESGMYSDHNTCSLALSATVNQGRERYCGICPVVQRATIEARSARQHGRTQKAHPRP